MVLASSTKATERLTIFHDFDHFARCLDALEQGNYDSRRWSKNMYCSLMQPDLILSFLSLVC